MPRRNAAKLRTVGKTNRILADAIHYYMKKAGISNAPELARLAGISESAAYNYAFPERRTRNGPYIKESGDIGKEGQTILVDRVELIAKALNCEVWQLLHPNPAFSDYLVRTSPELNAKSP